MYRSTIYAFCASPVNHHRSFHHAAKLYWSIEWIICFELVLVDYADIGEVPVGLEPAESGLVDQFRANCERFRR